MIRHTVFFSTPDLRVHRFDHPPGKPHRDPPRERSDAYAISFVEQGGFDLLHPTMSSLAAGDLFVTRPGQSYRCRHRDGRTDDVCLTVSFPADSIESDGAQMDAVRRSGGRLVFRGTNRLRYLYELLVRRLGADHDAAQALGLALWQALSGPPPARLYRDLQLRWYASRIDQARERMAAHFVEPLTLASLARSVGMSTFHFCRVFSELAGMPPHRYLQEVRLRAAARLLAEGASVTAACLGSGFQDLSHFIHVFTRRFSVNPSRYCPK